MKSHSLRRTTLVLAGLLLAAASLASADPTPRVAEDVSVTILSSNLDAPIVPIAIDGAYDVWPRTGSLRWARLLPFVGSVRMAFGEPLTFPDYRADAPPDYQQRTTELRDRVRRLLDEIRA